MRILLVEDDRHLGESLHRALQLAHYACDWIGDGGQVLRVLDATHYDLLVLDIGLPGRSGLDVLREMRRNGLLTPVLLLTARDSVEDKVRGLDQGADALGCSVPDRVGDTKPRGAAVDGGAVERAERFGARARGVFGDVHDRQPLLHGEADGFLRSLENPVERPILSVLADG